MKKYPCPTCDEEGFICVDGKTTWCNHCGTLSYDGLVQAPDYCEIKSVKNNC